MTTITPEERQKWREQSEAYRNADTSTDYKITRLLDALEAAEAARNALANYLSWHGQSRTTVNPLMTAQDFLEWAAQKAAKDGE